MKFSLAWVFDHISGLSAQDAVAHGLFDRITASVAEVGIVRESIIHTSTLFCVSVQGKNEQGLECTITETGEKLVLSRPNLPVISDGYLLVVRDDIKGWRWATMLDLGGIVEGEVGYISLDSEAARSGAWRSQIEQIDTVLTIDNVALTHRPDLWGHRGLAREITALYTDGKLRTPDQLGAPLNIRSDVHLLKADAQFPYELEITHPELCRRFGVVYLPRIVFKPSPLSLVIRLARVDARSINTIVDLANYGMYDWGYPLHTFDASLIRKGRLAVTNGKADEQLTLLDGTEIILHESDTVIVDGSGPVGLAGIMGGNNSRVTDKTTSLLVEAGGFQPIPIRSTSARLKKRSEASTRFEKGLDAEQIPALLARFVQLARNYGIIDTSIPEFRYLGAPYRPHSVTVDHAFLERRIGTSLSSDRIRDLLTRLGCIVKTVEKNNVYHVEVPSYRARDLKIPEDFIEEVGRLNGYDTLEAVLPSLQRSTWPLGHFLFHRALRHSCAFGARARELRSYAFYDETFLQKIQYAPQAGYELSNPVAETSYRLVDSLIPHLLKAVWNAYDTTHEEQIRFFEMGRIWQMRADSMHEESSAALVLYTRSKEKNQFYFFKDLVESVLKAVHVTVDWRARMSSDAQLAPWYHPFQSAFLQHGDELIIGTAGMVHPKFLPSGRGAAFCVELNIARLYAAADRSPVMKPLPKYQDSTLDISVLASYEKTVESLQKIFASVDPLIVKTELIDFFEQPEWNNKRSVTVRLTLRAHDKTLTHDDIARVERAVHAVCTKHELQVR